MTAATGGTPDLDQREERAVAMLVIDDARFWIQNGDTKAAFLAAVLGLMLAAVVQEPGPVRAALHPTGAADMAATALLGLFICCQLVSALFLLRSQIPTRDRLSHVNRFSFPTIASRQVVDIAGPDAEHLTYEAWEQGILLAAIAVTKFHLLRYAAYATAAAIVTFLAWTALSVA